MKLTINKIIASGITVTMLAVISIYLIHTPYSLFFINSGCVVIYSCALIRQMQVVLCAFPGNKIEAKKYISTGKQIFFNYSMNQTRNSNESIAFFIYSYHKNQSTGFKNEKLKIKCLPTYLSLPYKSK